MYVIESLVSNLSGEEKGWFTKIFEGTDVAKGLGEYASQVLRKRKIIDKEILNLLGEIKTPYTKLFVSRLFLMSSKMLKIA